MRRTGLLFIALFVAGSLHAAEISSYIAQCEVMVSAPSLESLNANVRVLLKRFYAKNYAQMIDQIGGKSFSAYGVDILDVKSLSNAGLDTKKPLAFVHLTGDIGYLVLPVAAKKTAESFIKRNFGTNMYYKFTGNYVLLSSDSNAVLQYQATNLLEQNAGYQLAAKKSGFDWDGYFVWMENRYLSSISQSAGVSDNMNFPYGFFGFTAELTNASIRLNGFTGIMTAKSVELMQSLRHVGGAEKYNILDYISGTPAVMGSVNLNIPALYRFYQYIDSLDIMGYKSKLTEMLNHDQVNFERDFIDNADGRIRFVVDRYDASKNDMMIYGSIGIKKPEVAANYIKSLKNAMIKNNEKLYTFELFSKPFYHYRTENQSYFFGVMDNEFFFSTDKDTLVNLARAIYEGRGGSLENTPVSFQSALSNKSPGIFIQSDAQSLFSNVKTGTTIGKDFLVGLKEVRLKITPDSDALPYGWNTSAELLFYQ